MSSTLTELTLPTSGLKVLVGPSGLPLFIHLPQDGSMEQPTLELEALHGWRVALSTISRRSDPGHRRVVEWVGWRAQPMSYAEFSSAPVHSYPATAPEGICGLVGVHSFSRICQISREWKGHPIGTWLVWASDGGGECVCGFARKVGTMELLHALLDERESKEATCLTPTT